MKTTLYHQHTQIMTEVDIKLNKWHQQETQWKWSKVKSNTCISSSKL